jgi:hypothetical protein
MGAKASERVDVDLPEKLASILNEPAVLRINFAMRGLKNPVAGSELKKVAARLGRGQIKPLVSAELRNDVTGPDAEYDSATNELRLKSGRARDFASPTSKGLIVHEAIHALQDMNKETGTTKLTAEAAAFIGQTIYRIVIDGPSGLETMQAKIQQMLATDGGDIFRECLRLVKECDMLSKRVSLEARHYEDLRHIIKRHDAYRQYGFDEKITADGIACAGAFCF